MAKVTGAQSIPPEWLDEYRGTLTEKQPNGIVRKRYPYHVPTLENIGFAPSLTQREVRQTFKKCTRCFDLQPESGGVTPPAQGPRNRSYWYNESIGSGLFYFDYFMQQTLNAMFADGKIDWCWQKIYNSAYVSEYSPNTNYGNHVELKVDGRAGLRCISYVEINNKRAKYLNIRWHGVLDGAGGAKGTKIEFYTVKEQWWENTITWNNKPPLINLIETKTLNGYGKEWFEIEIPEVFGIAIKWLSGPETVTQITFDSDDATITDRRPYLT